MALQTRKCDPELPPRIVVVGAPGVGKTTLGAKAPNPIVISPEGGADHLTDVNGNSLVELLVNGQPITTWDGLIAGIDSLIKEKHDYQTLVLDTADWIEKICHAYILKDAGGKSMTTAYGGFNAAFRKAETLHRELIEKLSELRTKKRMGFVITSHYHVKPVKDAEVTVDYDAFEIKCHEMVAPIWKEWADAIFFIREKLLVNDRGEGRKSDVHGSGELVLYAKQQPFFHAKNRYKMPTELPYTENFWNDTLIHYIKPQETWDQVMSEIDGLLPQVKDEKALASMKDFVEKCKQPEPNLTALRKIRDRIKAAIEKQEK